MIRKAFSNLKLDKGVLILNEDDEDYTPSSVISFKDSPMNFVRIADRKPLGSNSKKKKENSVNSKDVLIEMFELFGVHADEEDMASPRRVQFSPRKETSEIPIPSSHLSILLLGTPMAQLEAMIEAEQSRKKKYNQKTKQRKVTREEEKENEAKSFLQSIEFSSLIYRRMRYQKFRQIMIESIFHSPSRGNIDNLLGYNSRERSNNFKMTAMECYTKMCYLASLRCPECSVEEAIEKCCLQYLVPYFSQTVNAATKLLHGFCSWITDDADVAAMFHFYQAPLHRLLLHYSKKNVVEGELSKTDLLMGNNTMSLASLLEFAKDFQVIPNFVREKELCSMYEAIKSLSQTSITTNINKLSPNESSSIKTNLNIREFTEIIARIAGQLKKEDTIQNKCRDILDYLEMKYVEKYGEPMLEEKYRVLRTRLTRNKIDRTQLDLHFDFNTITGESGVLMSKEEASALREQSNKREDEISSSTDVFSSKRGHERFRETHKLVEESDQNLILLLGEEIGRFLLGHDLIFQIFQMYCSVEAMNDTQNVLSLRQWQSLYSDLGILESLGKYLGNEEETEDFLNSLFVNKSTLVLDNVRYLTYHDLLHALYSIWERIFEGYATKLKNSGKIMDLGNFVKEHFNSGSLHRASSHISRGSKILGNRCCALGSDSRYLKIPKRKERQFDIFKGPKMIAKCQNQPGVVLYEGKKPNGDSSNWERCSYMTLVMLNLEDEGVDFEEETRYHIRLHASIAHSFDQFLERLLDYGLDFIGSIYPLQVYSSRLDVTQRQDLLEVNRILNLGRSWRLRNSQFKVVGFLLDSPGYFCCLDWIPAADSLFSELYSVTMYINPSEPEFTQCFDLFHKCKDIAAFRERLEESSIVCVGSLYSVLN